MTAPHECDNGWRRVTEAWVEKRHPMPVRRDGMDDATFAEAVRQVEMRRAGSRETVYPCKVCRPTEFYRWATGHMEPDHDRSQCDECRDAPGGNRRRRAPTHGRVHEPEPMPEPPPDLVHEPEMF
jgi:hypothetical protein